MFVQSFLLSCNNHISYNDSNVDYKVYHNTNPYNERPVISHQAHRFLLFVGRKDNSFYSNK